MNERIKELAEQAGLKQRIWNSLGRELPIWQEDPDNPGLAKFAELIINECVAWVEEHNGHDGPSTSEMKKHFGVEE